MQLVRGAQSKLDQIVKEIQGCMVTSVISFLRMGELLKLIRDSNYWQIDGNAVTFAEFCEREVRLRKSQVYNAIAVFEKYGPVIGQDKSLAQMDHSRLVRLLPFTTPENTEELLHTAATVDAKGFEAHIANLRGKVAHDECEHLGEWEAWNRCPDCGKFLRVASQDALQGKNGG